ncbi:MAG TPA: ATP-binding cassette domain-containing protein [Treponema sp.]|nr:ATP-binding cassette domain-containing protein [Treponema sp.]
MEQFRFQHAEYHMDKPQRAELNRITKIFESPADHAGGVARFVALDKVSIRFSRGELHSILGENGAGKSTLVHLLSGLHKPTSGNILLDEEKTFFKSPADALDQGIAMVHQRPLLANSLSVFENIVLSSQAVFVRRRCLIKKVTDLAESWNIGVNLFARTHRLTPADRLKTALLSALYSDPSFLILDEPTAILPPEEREPFMESISRAAVAGLGIIIITHKIEEAARWSDRISILNRGKLIYSEQQKEHALNTDGLKKFFPNPTPQRLDSGDQQKQSLLIPRGYALTISNLSANPKNREPLENINFTAEAGSITGILAFPGSGLDTLEDVLSGMITAESGTLTLTKPGLTPFHICACSLTPALLRSHGVAVVPSNRAYRGSHPALSITEALCPYRSNHFIMRHQNTEGFAQNLLQEEQIAENPFRTVSTLSGGQLQKLILSRELSTNPRVLILADPEWGLDIPSISRLRERLKRIAGEGTTVLILTDTPETMEISDFYTKTESLKEGRII